jgi:glutamate-1-semialdehyde 2,1-aminomutase
LIFDEVMTGFRIRYGGVQELTGIQADLVTLGKIVGGGMPLAVYGGQRKLMEQISPLGPVYQAGTLSGNPVAVAAGIATLKELKKADYDALSALTKKLSNGLELLAKEHRIPFIAHSEGGMFGFFFCDEAVSNYQKAAACDSKAFRAFFWGMLEQGIYLPPSSFEAGFTSFSHTPNDVEETLIAAKCAFEGVNSVL